MENIALETIIDVFGMENIEEIKEGEFMRSMIIDTETTGLTDPRPVEIAWLGLKDIASLEIVDEFEQRYNPEKPIEFGAMAVHHILDEDVADKPSCETFKLPEETEYIIGHNIDYDWEAVGRPDVKRIDTLALSRRIWKDAGSHSLGALMYMLAKDKRKVRERLKSAHSAMTDVKMCRFVLSKIVRELGVESWDNLWHISEEYRIPESMPFGKHKGTLISELPPDYIEWAVTNLKDIDPYLKKALLSAV